MVIAPYEYPYQLIKIEMNMNISNILVFGRS